MLNIYTDSYIKKHELPNLPVHSRKFANKCIFSCFHSTTKAFTILHCYNFQNLSHMRKHLHTWLSWENIYTPVSAEKTFTCISWENNYIPNSDIKTFTHISAEKTITYLSPLRNIYTDILPPLTAASAVKLLHWHQYL